MVFTTRPDTSFGMTYAVMAPEHPLAMEVTTPDRRGRGRAPSSPRRATRATSTACRRKGRSTSAVCSPVPTSSTRSPGSRCRCTSPTTCSWATAPARSWRCRARTSATGTSPRPTACRSSAPSSRPRSWDGEAYTGDGPAINSEWLDGLDKADAIAKAIEWLEEQGIGERKVNYRLRDWLLSRQRFWGCPIPVVYCPDARPGPGARRPAARAGARRRRVPAHGRVAAAVPRGLPAHDLPDLRRPGMRETDTMDTFVDSSWYFLRFTDAWNEDEPFSLAAAESWMPVDQYIGGIEHAILHLMYARFFTKALADLGRRARSCASPSSRLFTQGMIRLGGDKMSKSKGNLVAPEEILDHQGADALRLAHLFVGPPQDDVDWEGVGIEGCSRFLNRLWRLARWATESAGLNVVERGPRRRPTCEWPRPTHRLIARVTDDYERWSYNTAVAAFMEFTNELYRYVQADAGARPETLAFAIDTLLQLMAPMAPHITAELWAAPGRSCARAGVAGGRPGHARGRDRHDGRAGQRQGARPHRRCRRASTRRRPSSWLWPPRRCRRSSTDGPPQGHCPAAQPRKRRDLISSGM